MPANIQLLLHKKYVQYFFIGVSIISILSLSCVSLAQATALPPKFIKQIIAPPAVGKIAYFSPESVAFDTSGNMYVGDERNNIVQKFDPSGNYVSQFGGFGSGDGQLWSPTAVAISTSTGDVFVADNSNSRFEEFSPSGAYINQWDVSYYPDFMAMSPLTGIIYAIDYSASDGYFINEYDQSGNLVNSWGDTSQFGAPSGIAFDNSGDIYITDAGNLNVQEFYPDNSFDRVITSTDPNFVPFQSPLGIAVDNSGNVYVTDIDKINIQKFDSNGNYVATWGTIGSGQGQFQGPIDVAIDSSNNVYVVDNTNNNIQKFTPSGAFVTEWEDMGTGNGQFDNPSGLATDATGNVYVTDSGNDRVQKFDKNGGYLSQWGTFGSSTGQFFEPTSIAIDPQGNVYVGDHQLSTVQVFDSSGNYMAQIGTSNDDGSNSGPGSLYDVTGVAFATSTNTVYVNESNALPQEFAGPASTTTTPYSFIKYFASTGRGNGQFRHGAVSLTISPVSGDIYALAGGIVQEFDQHDNYIAQWPISGSANSIIAGSDGNIYGIDSNHGIIDEYDPSGNLLTSWGAQGFGDGQFSQPNSIAVNPDGYVYVSDSSNNRISVFSNDYTPPLVAVTAPTASSTVSGTITLTASSTDTQSGLASIQFQVDGNNVGTVGTSSPYSISYDASGLSAGAHAITAIAYDNVGNYATSSAVTITVDTSSSGGGGGANVPEVQSSGGNIIQSIAPVSSVVECPVGARFNSVTGARCASFSIAGCSLGYVYNILTGSLCQKMGNASTTMPTALLFTRNLAVGSRGQSVRALQVYLNAHGFIVAATGHGSPGFETTYFGLATKNALIRFQKFNGIKPANGRLGPVTRLFISNNH